MGDTLVQMNSVHFSHTHTHAHINHSRHRQQYETRWHGHLHAFMLVQTSLGSILEQEIKTFIYQIKVTGTGRQSSI
jgi:hypothetical protein